jgi:hypothetical protein
MRLLLATATAGVSLALVGMQLGRVLRLRDAAGVSAAGLAGSVIGYVGWTLHAARTGDWLAAAAVGAPGALQAANLIVSLRYGAERRDTLVPAAVAATLALGYFAMPAAMFAVALLAASAAAYAPTVRAAWFAPDIRGVSRLAWAAASLHGAAWGAYGVVTQDLYITASGALNLTASAAIVTATYVRSAAWDEHAAKVT